MIFINCNVFTQQWWWEFTLLVSLAKIIIYGLRCLRQRYHESVATSKWWLSINHAKLNIRMLDRGELSTCRLHKVELAATCGSQYVETGIPVVVREFLVNSIRVLRVGLRGTGFIHKGDLAATCGSHYAWTGKQTNSKTQSYTEMEVKFSLDISTSLIVELGSYMWPHLLPIMCERELGWSAVQR